MGDRAPFYWIRDCWTKFYILHFFKNFSIFLPFLRIRFLEPIQEEDVSESKIESTQKMTKTTFTKNDVRTQLTTTTTENDIQQRSRDGGKNNVKLDVSTLEKRRYNVTSDASYDVITWRDVGKNDVNRGVFDTTFKSSVAVENDVKMSLHQPPMVLLIPKSWLVSLKRGENDSIPKQVNLYTGKVLTLIVAFKTILKIIFA